MKKFCCYFFSSNSWVSLLNVWPAFQKIAIPCCEVLIMTEFSIDRFVTKLLLYLTEVETNCEDYNVTFLLLSKVFVMSQSASTQKSICQCFKYNDIMASSRYYLMPTISYLFRLIN